MHRGFVLRVNQSLKWRLRRFLTSRREIGLFQIPQGGLFHYPVNSQIGRALFFNEFEPAEVNFIQRVLRSGDTLVDIGANAGLYSILGGRLVGPSGKVIAFEPGLFESALFQLNVRTNQLTNVQLINKGVSDTEGIADFILSEDGAMNSLKRTHHPDQHPVASTQIQTTTLSRIIDELDIDNLRLIKIDTEGAERQIILSSAHYFKHLRRALILFESQDANNRAYSYSAQSFLRELIQHGATISLLQADGSTEPIDPSNTNIGNLYYNFVASFQ